MTQSQPAYSDSDAEHELWLLERLREADPAAFEEFVRMHAGRALATARRILHNEADAAEAVQDALLSFFNSLASFKGQSRVGTWLHRIVVNAALMKRRTRRRKPEVNIEDLLPRFYTDGHRIDPAPPWQPSAEDFTRQLELRELVNKKIAQLPEDFRNVLVLRDIQEVSTEEAARHPRRACTARGRRCAGCWRRNWWHDGADLQGVHRVSRRLSGGPFRGRRARGV